MSVDRYDKGCNCGGAGAVNLHQISSIVRDIREQPCLNNSPIKGNKMLKPEKWHTVFDSDGRVLGFKKALKLIILGDENSGSGGRSGPPPKRYEAGDT
ncbi:small G protein signaling modulator 1-like protein isoform X1 [Cinnamomum micranthum f. kanehirae]|uniref:Small G protein signaling modulator 1-like protein isoform X1 n=1 Tax=Cinnamomum micranthum f. kanehirae TaxID=337451 RepID=A0A3S3N6F4_9MAGN|nr:small G protein signaling modulator 1-like protein isoform X1 [Cinnamomum micranthum f. kanehirae]